MTILEALVQLRDDLKTWVTNNLKVKVDIEDGKGLSTNDYTTAEKEKLAALSVDQVSTKVSYGEPQTLTEEQKTQARENIGAVSKDDFGAIATTIQVPININDEVYDDAHFSTDGNSLWDVGQGYGLMSKNYLPVIGGKTIEAIYGNNTFGEANARVVQYNSKKEKIADITDLRPKISKGLPTSDNSTPKQLTLNKKTTFIKFCISHWTQGTIIEDTQITIAYVEDAVTDYVDRYVTKEQIYIDAPTKSEFEELSVLVGDTAVSTQITNAIAGLATKTYVDGKIATAIELPAVTATNNGAVLGVVDGKWAITTILNAEEVEF